MICTIILDLWRLLLGGITEASAASLWARAARGGPWALLRGLMGGPGNVGMPWAFGSQ